MTKRRMETHATITYLKVASRKKIPYKEMAGHIGVCVDTVKRMLSRHGIEDFDGAKYAFPPETKMWNRPCMGCGTTVTRPKNLYYCDKCRPTSQLGDQWEDYI
jgi:hypothetical protein